MLLFYFVIYFSNYDESVPTNQKKNHVLTTLVQMPKRKQWLLQKMLCQTINIGFHPVQLTPTLLEGTVYGLQKVPCCHLSPCWSHGVERERRCRAWRQIHTTKRTQLIRNGEDKRMTTSHKKRVSSNAISRFTFDTMQEVMVGLS